MKKLLPIFAIFMLTGCPEEEPALGMTKAEYIDAKLLADCNWKRDCLDPEQPAALVQQCVKSGKMGAYEQTEGCAYHEDLAFSCIDEYPEGVCVDEAGEALYAPDPCRGVFTDCPRGVCGLF